MNNIPENMIVRFNVKFKFLGTAVEPMIKFQLVDDTIVRIAWLPTQKTVTDSQIANQFLKYILEANPDWRQVTGLYN